MHFRVNRNIDNNVLDQSNIIFLQFTHLPNTRQLIRDGSNALLEMRPYVD